MSNFFLTTITYDKAQRSMDDFIKEYNNPELTQKGKRESLLNCIAFSFMGGFKLAEDEVKKLQSENEDLKKDLEWALGLLIGPTGYIVSHDKRIAERFRDKWFKKDGV
jgi:hypothetical protein